jgi:hypothetical protein
VLLFPGFLLIAGTTTAISGIIWVLNRNHKWQGTIIFYIFINLQLHFIKYFDFFLDPNYF